MGTGKRSGFQEETDETAGRVDEGGFRVTLEERHWSRANSHLEH